jgi:ATP-binding cassette subfamily C (CFTR/MRP) protein 1
MPLIFIKTVASAFATAKTSALIGTAQLAWILAIQKRIVVTAGTLGAMKSIKLSGLTGRSFSIMRNLRIAELEASKKMRKILVWIILFSE